MNSLALGGIIKRIYPNFDITYFDYRLKLQKIVYLLQSYGINLGYSFSLYLYGPYSPELTKTAFEYMGDIKNIQEVRFEDGLIETKFKEFLSIIKEFKENTNWLEMASTIHLFANLYNLKDKKEIVGKVFEVKPKFSKEEIEKVFEVVKEWIMKN